jgi:hypothetical protein
MFSLNLERNFQKIGCKKGLYWRTRCLLCIVIKKLILAVLKFHEDLFIKK